eukprot:GHRQ01036164.1.p1 GENE.GHRQ01036164.1~~GHRQ01036164.1.p1  ORF type:complete len:145 (-),score=36.22 GHRQ01036164.1:36-470(-)
MLLSSQLVSYQRQWYHICMLAPVTSILSCFKSVTHMQQLLLPELSQLLLHLLPLNHDVRHLGALVLSLLHGSSTRRRSCCNDEQKGAAAGCVSRDQDAGAAVVPSEQHQEEAADGFEQQHQQLAGTARLVVDDNANSLPSHASQ